MLLDYAFEKIAYHTRLNIRPDGPCSYIPLPGGYSMVLYSAFWRVPIILDQVSGRITYASIFGFRAANVRFFILLPGK